jgi:hypothetical protein
MREIFSRSQKLLKDLVDDGLLDYILSLEQRHRAPDDSVADLTALKQLCPLSQQPIEVDRRSQKIIAILDSYLSDTTDIAKLSSEQLLLREVDALAHAVKVVPEIEPLNTNRLIKSHFSNQVLTSLLYQFRSSFLLRILSLGEEDAGFEPKEDNKRRQDRRDTLAQESEIPKWSALPRYPFILTQNQIHTEYTAIFSEALSILSNKLPLLVDRIMKNKSLTVFLSVEDSPGLIENEYVLCSSGQLSEGDNKSYFLAINAWSSDDCHNIDALLTESNGPKILAYCLISSLVKILSLTELSEYAIEDTPEALCISHTLQHTLLHGVLSEELTVKALAEYRPFYTGQMLLNSGVIFFKKENIEQASKLSETVGLGYPFTELWDKSTEYCYLAL